MLTLTFLGIVVVAIAAHVSSGRSDDGTRWRWLESRWVLAPVFAGTFLALWYAWAAWNPIPVVHDEMAYVLQSQIFARGAWSLPSPPFPLFWEQPHVLTEPRLASKYFPGHSLLMTPGALVGWPALMPLVLQSTAATLAYVLARRVANGAVALLAWVLWLGTFLVLYFGASYYSEATTTVCWLAGWYALLRWREDRRLRWLLAVAFFTGWGAITRPLTGLAYAIPVGVVVLHDVVRGRRWRDLGYALAMGIAVLSLLLVWSATTTGDWRQTPLGLYTRNYMPYDVPGFGVVQTPPAHSITPDLAQWNNVYRASHITHFPANLPGVFVQRIRYLADSIWGASGGVFIIFAVMGLFTLAREARFALASAIVLLLTYLSFATPPSWTLYYYETVPVYAYLTAAGVAWLCSLAGRPRAPSELNGFDWRSRRLVPAVLTACVALAVPGLAALVSMHRQHIGDRQNLERFDRLLASIHDERAVMFVRYSGMHNPHVALVRNVPDLERARIWVVYDRGAAENARLMAVAPGRTAYLFDEQAGRTYVYDPREDIAKP